MPKVNTAQNKGWQASGYPKGEIKKPTSLIAIFTMNSQHSSAELVALDFNRQYKVCVLSAFVFLFSFLIENSEWMQLLSQFSYPMKLAFYTLSKLYSKSSNTQEPSLNYMSESFPIQPMNNITSWVYALLWASCIGCKEQYRITVFG